jgi:trigger factor
MSQQNRPFGPKEGAAEARDRVVVDFLGTIDGETFEGGSAEGITVEIGSGSFIPGFEEQLVGVTAGQTLKVNVTFPPNTVPRTSRHARRVRRHRQGGRPRVS